MPKLVLSRGLSTDLNSNSLKDGQIIFTEDTNELYIDFIQASDSQLIRVPVQDKNVAQLLQQHIQSLNKVENKSSEEIRDEITYENVINALGFVPSAGGSSTFAAEDITYSNTESGLTAADVQNAIDETVEKIAVNTTNIVALDNNTSILLKDNARKNWLKIETNSATLDSVLVTVDNGIAVLNGTDGGANSGTAFDFTSNITELPNGKYILSVENDAANLIWLKMSFSNDNEISMYLTSTQQEQEFEITDEVKAKTLRLVWNTNATFNNTTIKPMIRLISVIDSTWESYYKTNRELTEETVTKEELSNYIKVVNTKLVIG